MQTETTIREVEPVPVWRCRNAACKAWVREELAASANPSCPLCQGTMVKSIKHLPKLVKKHQAKKTKTHSLVR